MRWQLFGYGDMALNKFVQCSGQLLRIMAEHAPDGEVLHGLWALP